MYALAMLPVLAAIDPCPLPAATITIVNRDGPNEGLNDPTPATPVGGNTGTTVGQQRFRTLQHAAEIWAAKIESSVEILVEANFDSLACSSTSGILGAAGAFTFFRDFQGAPLPATLYPVALANAYAGSDLDPADPDIVAQFNSDVGTPGCLSSASWYYGFDGNAPAGSFDFFKTALHELVHGLGFITLVNLNNGTKPNGFNDTFMLHLEDHSTGELFPTMTDAERADAVTDPGDLHWTGTNVVNASAFLVAGRHPSGHVEMYAPNPVNPGSSVSHFSSSLLPDELMEPFANRTSDRRLTTALLQDIGWTILPDSPLIEPAGSSLASEECLPPNLAIDPGETVSVLFSLKNIGNGITDNLIATLLATNSIVPLDGPQIYGTLASGGIPVSKPFRFYVTAPCGAAVQPVFQLRDGTNQLGTASFLVRLGASAQTVRAFTNTTSIAIPGSGRAGPANPYPSTISVSGFTNPINRVTVTLRQLSHDFPDQLDIVLQGPQGQAVLIMSDAGGGANATSLTLTLDDTAPNALPDSGALTSGTFQPSNYGTGDVLPAPAPPPPYASTLAPFQNSNPNGTWRLFILDDSSPHTGELTGGWSLQFYSDLPPVCCQSSDLAADLKVLANPLPDLVAPSTGFSWNVIVTNQGPETAISTILVHQLQGAAIMANAVPSVGSCSLSNRTVTCLLGNLAPSSAAMVTLEITPGPSGTITNQLLVSTKSTDPVPGNNSLAAVAVINGPPVISTILDQIINEDTVPSPIPFTVQDPNTPAHLLTVTARSVQTNLIANSSITLGGVGTNRTIAFVPNTNAFGTAILVISALDGLNSTQELFFVTINPVNDAPVLDPIPNQTLLPGSTVSLTNHAFDVDSPPSTLRFRLPNPPPGASLHPDSGLFTWTPDLSLAGSTQSVTIVVEDNASPPLTDAKSFRVSILPLPRITSVQAGETTLILTWPSLPGTLYRLQSTLHLSDPEWTNVPGDILATGDTTSLTLTRPGPQQFYRLVLPPNP